MRSRTARPARVQRSKAATAYRILIAFVALSGLLEAVPHLHTGAARFAGTGALGSAASTAAAAASGGGGDDAMAAEVKAAGAAHALADAANTNVTVGATTGLMRLLQAAKRYRAHNDRQQMLRHRDIQRALYMGDSERIRSFVRRMAEGQNLTIALLGGSVSKGMGAVSGEPSFEHWITMWLEAVVPAASAAATEAGSATAAADGVPGERVGGVTGVAAATANSSVRVVNAACPATGSAYMNLCLREYLRDADVDLILVDYAINDAPFPAPPMINEERKSFEQLVRKLLRLPRRPAVVLLNMYRWYSQVMLSNGRPSNAFYSTNAEAQFFEFATYYGLPLISVKAAVYHHMIEGTRGFQVDSLRYQHRDNASADPEALFYEDPMHPSGLTGHRAISELVAGMLLSVARGLIARPWRQSEGEYISAPLPPHMIPDNYDTDLDMCLMGDNLRAAAVDIQGFQWINEGRSPQAPKWGYTAVDPNASIVFSITSAADTVGASGAGANSTAAAVEVADSVPAVNRHANLLLIIAYLRSYENMGVAAVSCEGGCVCGADAVAASSDVQVAEAVAAAAVAAAANGGGSGSPGRVIARLDGLSTESNSQLRLGCFPALMLAPVGCRLRVRVDDVGRSGYNKVKLGGIIVSHTAPQAAHSMCLENLEAAERAAGFRERL